jgi:sigma-B regulation protein RsbU (phosphoserine phosphatase)
MAVQPLLRTLPGRAIVVGVAVKLLVFAARLGGSSVPALVAVIDTVAGLAIAAGAGYFLVQLVLLARRRLLWRVRRKLILSYIFIGFVPAMLIVVFFLLGALLLFFNFSSYLVQTEVRSLSDRVRLAATTAVLEIQRDRTLQDTLGRMQAGLQSEFPGVSIAVVPVTRACGSASRFRPEVPQKSSELRGAASERRAGPWTHLDPPASVPAWIGCEGFAGLLASSRRESSGEVAAMFVRGVAFPDSPMPGYAVVIDLPDISDRLRRNTGVELRAVSAVGVAGRTAKPLEGLSPEPRGAGNAATLASARGAQSGPLSWVTFLDYHDWNSGEPGSLLVTTQLNLQDIYGRISAAQGVVGDRPFGQALLLVLLVVVGGLFFVIEVVALVAGSALARSITGSVHELFTGTEHVLQGDFSHKIAITARDQLGELAGSFNAMTASIEDLMRQKEEKKRLEEELRIAHEIQM